MRYRGHRALDLSQPLYAKRTMAALGVDVGDLFPWRDLGLTERKVTQLWDQRRIGHEQIHERNGAEYPVYPKPAVAGSMIAPVSPDMSSARPQAPSSRKPQQSRR
jgi:hypothetical protein